jgi:excisionase family DNA binding protein
MSSQATLLTAREVADEFRVHTTTVTRWVRDGRLSAIKTPGGRLRFRRDEVETLLQSTPVEELAAE